MGEIQNIEEKKSAPQYVMPLKNPEVFRILNLLDFLEMDHQVKFSIFTLNLLLIH
jgi:hypothetical protein